MIPNPLADVNKIIVKWRNIKSDINSVSALTDSESNLLKWFKQNFFFFFHQFIRRTGLWKLFSCEQKHIGCAVYLCLYLANDIIILQDFRFLMMLKIIFKKKYMFLNTSAHKTSQLQKCTPFYGGFLFLKVLKPV